jgi:hypothetical protein
LHRGAAHGGFAQVSRPDRSGPVDGALDATRGSRIAG